MKYPVINENFNNGKIRKIVLNLPFFLILGKNDKFENFPRKTYIFFNDYILIVG